MWIDGFYIIDFQRNEVLFESMLKFIENDVATFDLAESKILFAMLHNPCLEFNTFAAGSVSKSNMKSKVYLNPLWKLIILITKNKYK